MEVCPPSSDIALGLRGPASDFEALETPVHLSGAQLLCRAAESEARCGRVAPLGTGRPGRIHRHPLLPSHTCQGGCPQWSWGPDPRVGLHGLASSPCLLTSASQRGRRGAQLAGAHLSAQFISCLGSGRLCTLAPNFPPERDVLG